MQMSELVNNRVFFGGHRKSGTTLPISLLDGHPDLFVYPYETHFWYSFYPLYSGPDIPIEDKNRRILDFIFGDLKQIIHKWMKLDETQLNFSYKELEGRFIQQISTTQWWKQYQ